MRFARYSFENRIHYGIVDGNEVEDISTTPFLPFDRTGVKRQLGAVRLLSPCLPSKVIGIGHNYRAHAKEMGAEVPDDIVFFFMPSTCVIGSGDEIVRPTGSIRLDYEGELGVVVGTAARNVAAQHWQKVVLGYTCANDATARDWQRKDSQWGRAKGFDTSCSLGPWIETELDPLDCGLKTSVNGELRQKARTSDCVFSVPEIIEYVTKYLTLLPGDVVITGTPSGMGELHDGDVVEVEIEGVGTLGNVARVR